MVNILLATYHGEPYLRSQLDSILNQSYRDFKIYIRDDCSLDLTRQIILEYVENYKEKIYFIKSDIPSNSAKNNFFALMSYKDFQGDYFMFCDQDDIWLPDKIEKSINKIHEIAEDDRKNIPLLIHTDLEIVNDKLEIISKSFIHYQNLDPYKNKLNYLLVQNNITGCTVFFNRKLLELALAEDISDILMHDWWLGLCAAAFGKIIYIDYSTIKYRQHENNQVGAKNARSLKYIIPQFIKSILSGNKMILTNKQALAFFNNFETKLSLYNLDIVKSFISLKNAGKFKRIYLLFKYKLFCQSFMRKIGQIIIYLLSK